LTKSLVRFAFRALADSAQVAMKPKAMLPQRGNASIHSTSRFHGENVIRCSSVEDGMFEVRSIPSQNIQRGPGATAALRGAEHPSTPEPFNKPDAKRQKYGVGVERRKLQ
jgi:hypothetical protein